MKKLLSLLFSILLVITILPVRVIKANSVSVTFDANGGTFDGETTATVVTNADGTINNDVFPQSPSRTGYLFDGFYLLEEKIDLSTIFEEDSTVIAKWIANETNITLNSDGGLDGDESVVGTFDQNLPNIITPNKTGKQFLGYFDNDNNQYFDENGNSTRTWDKDTKTYELVAKYDDLPLLGGTPNAMYKATMKLEGGLITGTWDYSWTWEKVDNQTYVKYFSQYTSFEEIYAEWDSADLFLNKSKVFGGWTKDNGDYFFQKDTVFTAKWVNLYTVTVDLSNCLYDDVPEGWEEIDDNKYEKGYNEGYNYYYIQNEWANSSDVNLRKTDYYLSEWNNSSSDKSYVIESSTLTPVWQPMLTATVKLNGGSIYHQPPGWTKVDDQTYTKKYAKNVFTSDIINEWVQEHIGLEKDGYSIYMVDDSPSKRQGFILEPTTVYTYLTEDATFTPDWRADVKLTAKLDGGVASKVPYGWELDGNSNYVKTYKYNTELWPAILEWEMGDFLSKPDYVFKDWNHGYIYNITEDTEITAVWTNPISIGVSADSNGTVNVSSLSLRDNKTYYLRGNQVLDTDGTVIAEATPASGYAFSHWAFNGDKKTDSFSTNGAGNLVAYFCEGYDLWYKDTQVNVNNKSNIDGYNKVSYDPDTKTLSIDNTASYIFVKSDDDYYYGIKGKIDGLTINFIGNNNEITTDRKKTGDILSSGKSYLIYNEGDLTITGDSVKLGVTNNTTDKAIVVKGGNLTIKDINLECYTRKESIEVEKISDKGGKLTIDNSNVDIRSLNPEHDNERICITVADGLDIKNTSIVYAESYNYRAIKVTSGDFVIDSSEITVKGDEIGIYVKNGDLTALESDIFATTKDYEGSAISVSGDIYFGSQWYDKFEIDSKGKGIYSETGDISIEGTYYLNVNAVKHAIHADQGSVSLEECEGTIKATDEADRDGISSGKTITINKCKLEVVSKGDYGLKAKDGAITIQNNSVVTIDSKKAGIKNKDNSSGDDGVVIENSDVIISSKEKAISTEKKLTVDCSNLFAAGEEEVAIEANTIAVDKIRSSLGSADYVTYDKDYSLKETATLTDNKYFVNGVEAKTVSLKSNDKYDLWVANVQVNSANKSDILGNGKVSYNPLTNTLSITGGEDMASMLGIPYGIYSKDKLIIESTGYVLIENGFDDDSSYGIKAMNGLIIKAGEFFEVKNEDTTHKITAGIYANDLIIDSGNVEVYGGNYGIYCVNSLGISKTNTPTLTSYAKNTIAIKSNSMNLDGAYVYGTTEDYEEGVTNTLYQLGPSAVIVSYSPLSTQYDLWLGGTRVTADNASNIDGNGTSYDASTKTLTLKGNVYGKDGYGIRALDDLTIINDNGHSVYAYSSAIYSTGVSYGIYCEGDLTIKANNNKELYVSSDDAQTISVGVYCDGKLTINSKVYAASDYVDNLNEDFCISAGTWAQGGIEVIGESLEDNIYLKSYGSYINNGHFDYYGILAGDGNPGHEDASNIYVKNATIEGNVRGDNDRSSTYGIYSFGSIYSDNSTLKSNATISDNQTSYIYCDGNLDLVNSSKIENIYYDHSTRTGYVYTVYVGKTLTVEDSSIAFGESTSKVKKSYGIRANDIVVKGDSNINVKSLNTVDGDSVAIYVKNKLDIQDGVIYAEAPLASDNSFGIYAGANSFDGKHSISGGTITAIGGLSKCEEGAGFRIYKGDIDITGGELNASGDDYGINSSHVINVAKTSALIKPIITTSATSRNAIHSKEVLVLNTAKVENSSVIYDKDTTKDLPQSGTDPVIIYFKRVADVSGISLVYLEGKSTYTYGDTVSYTGTPIATDNVTGEVIPTSIIPTSSYIYKYYQEVEGDYEEVIGVPYNAGNYKLSITYDNSDYEGEQTILFSIAKKPVSLIWNSPTYNFDGIPHKPVFAFAGLLTGDTASFNTEPTYVYYDENTDPVESPISVGQYRVDSTVTAGNVVTIIDGSSTDVTANYDLASIIDSYSSTFYIFNSSSKSSIVTSGTINYNDSVTNTSVGTISLEEAKIASRNITEINNALNNNENVDFVLKIEEVSDPNVFVSKNIDQTNAFLFDANLYAIVENSLVEYQLLDTNEYNVKVTLYLTAAQASNIRISGNKEYYVLRQHNGTIDTLPATMSIEDGLYAFSFYSNKFSSFAICSKDKPVPSYVVPNTCAR